MESRRYSKIEPIVIIRFFLNKSDNRNSDKSERSVNGGSTNPSRYKQKKIIEKFKCNYLEEQDFLRLKPSTSLFYICIPTP